MFWASVAAALSRYDISYVRLAYDKNTMNDFVLP